MWRKGGEMSRESAGRCRKGRGKRPSEGQEFRGGWNSRRSERHAGEGWGSCIAAEGKVSQLFLRSEEACAGGIVGVARLENCSTWNIMVGRGPLSANLSQPVDLVCLEKKPTRTRPRTSSRTITDWGRWRGTLHSGNFLRSSIVIVLELVLGCFRAARGEIDEPSTKLALMGRGPAPTAGRLDRTEERKSTVQRQRR